MATSTHGARNSTFKYNETTTAPGVSNDNTEGYSIGSRWWDTTADKEHVCIDTSTGAAVWIAINPDGNYAGISISGNTVDTTISTQNVFVQADMFDTNDPSSGAAPDHTNDHITISETGDYFITASISFSSPGASGDTFELQIQKNNGATAFVHLHVERKVTAGGGGGDIGSASISGLASLSVNDTVELWVQNTTGTDDVLLRDVNLAIHKVPGIGGTPSRSSDKGFFLENATATDDFPIFRFDVASTLTKVVYAVEGTAPSVVCQLQEADDAQGTGAADTQADDSTVTTTTTVTSFSNADFDAGDYVVLKIVSSAGTVDWLHITFYYDED